MWPKSKKEQGDRQEQLQDYEQDMQALREERDELKAWCQELESRQRQQSFNQQLFLFWERAMADLREVNALASDAGQSLNQKNQHFLDYHMAYSERRKDLLEYVDGFTESYKQVNHGQQHLQQIQAHARSIGQCSAEVDGLAERLRLLSLNVAIESSHTDQLLLSDSLIASLREMSDSSRQVCAGITAINGRIDTDSRKAESYFTTVTEGFIGFSQAIGPLLSAADRSSELIMELAAIANEWSTVNLVQSMKVEHLLWKFDLYSQLLGINSGSIAGEDGLENWAVALPGEGEAVVQLKQDQFAALQLGERIKQLRHSADSSVLLTQLQALEQASQVLFRSFDVLRKAMLAG